MEHIVGQGHGEVLDELELLVGESFVVLEDELVDGVGELIGVFAPEAFGQEGVFLIDAVDDIAEVYALSEFGVDVYHLVLACRILVSLPRDGEGA